VHEHSSSRRRRKSIGTGTLALSLGLCLCAGQLVATPAASAAASAPVVAAAAAAAKKKPTVRTTFSNRVLKSGQSFKVTVKYINPVNNAAVTSGSVRLQAWRGGKWTNYGGAKKLGRSGTMTFSATPTMSLYFRTYYTGNGSVTSHTGSKFAVHVKVTSKSAKILAEAKKHVGALYKFGAAGPKRFDCSGYTMYVYRKTTGKKLPHKANSQQKYGTSVAKSKKKPGDLVVFRSGSYGYHAGIYAGNGYMYDSPHTGSRVSKRKMIGTNYVVRRLAA
jgi:cell wall-associated NlpC family hydrolase